MEQIENRMLREQSFEQTVEEVKRFDSSGWTRPSDGTFVPEESAFEYALDQCTNFVPPGLHKIEWTHEFQEMLVEWFYSGGEWRKED